MNEAIAYYKAAPNDEVEGIALFTQDDITKYNLYLNDKCALIGEKIITMSMDINKLDHYLNSFKGIEKVIIAFANALAKINSGNPLYLLNTAVTKLIEGMRKTMDRSGTLFVKNSGGYCPVDGLDYFEFFDEISYPPDEQTIFMKKDSKVLILENSFKLEDKAVNLCIEHLDTNYSYILQLRSLSSIELKQQMKKFVDNGGTTLYVYTTFLDYGQFVEYTESANSLGLKLVFTSSSGESKELFAAKKYMEENHINYSLL